MKVPITHENICKYLFWEDFSPEYILTHLQLIFPLVPPPRTEPHVGNDILLTVKDNWLVSIAHIEHADRWVVQHLLHTDLVVTQHHLVRFTPVGVERFVLFDVEVDLQRVVHQVLR